MEQWSQLHDVSRADSRASDRWSTMSCRTALAFMNVFVSVRSQGAAYCIYPVTSLVVLSYLHRTSLQELRRLVDRALKLGPAAKTATPGRKAVSAKVSVNEFQCSSIEMELSAFTHLACTGAIEK